jgi:hypothetical protein
MTMNIELFTTSHLADAADLVYKNYCEEASQLTALPLQINITSICKLLIDLAKNRTGVCAIENGKLIGFLSRIPRDSFFGNVKGIYCPLHSHGAIKENRKTIYQKMYQKAANIWVEQDRFTHAITIFAHESETIDTFFWQGFGLRCVDAIGPVKPIVVTSAEKYFIRRIMPNEANLINPLEHKLVQHMNSSPVFMSVYKTLTVERLGKWLTDSGNHMWAAFDNQNPIAYMIIQNDGENFVTESSDMMNICGAYTNEDVRGSGVSVKLLSHIMQWLLDNGYKRCVWILNLLIVMEADFG